MQTLLALFLALAAALLAAFLAYHCYMIARGLTTYEAFKRAALRRDLQLEAALHRSGAVFLCLYK